MINHVLNGGTLAVSLDGSGIGSYRGGIFSFCPTPTVNHAVHIVGVNVEGNYWIVRNSWGPWWGEQGNMRIALVSASPIIAETV